TPSPGGLTFDSAASAAASSGVAHIGGLHVRTVGTNYVLKAATSAHNATSSAFAVTPGALDKFQWSTIGDPQTAGVQFTPTVTAYDHWNNIKTNYSGAGATLSTTMSGSPTGCSGACTATANFHTASLHFTTGLGTIDATGYK